MSDTLMRHLVCICATLCFSVVYWAAYVSGQNGWWLTYIGVLFLYFIIYKLIGGGGGGHH